MHLSIQQLHLSTHIMSKVLDNPRSKSLQDLKHPSDCELQGMQIFLSFKVAPSLIQAHLAVTNFPS